MDIQRSLISLIVLIIEMTSIEGPQTVIITPVTDTPVTDSAAVIQADGTKKDTHTLFGGHHEVNTRKY